MWSVKHGEKWLYNAPQVSCEMSLNTEIVKIFSFVLMDGSRSTWVLSTFYILALLHAILRGRTIVDMDGIKHA